MIATLRANVSRGTSCESGTYTHAATCDDDEECDDDLLDDDEMADLLAWLEDRSMVAPVAEVPFTVCPTCSRIGCKCRREDRS